MEIELESISEGGIYTSPKKKDITTKVEQKSGEKRFQDSSTKIGDTPKDISQKKVKSSDKKIILNNIKSIIGDSVIMRHIIMHYIYPCIVLVAIVFGLFISIGIFIGKILS